MLSKIKDLEKSPSTKVIFIEGATILEAGFNKHFDEIWSSIVPKEDQVHRALNRSKLMGLGQSRGDLERWTKMQIGDEERKKMSNFWYDGRDSILKNWEKVEKQI